MVTLQIEHQVPSYEMWRQEFDSDPLNRKESGVKEIRIYRSVEDSNHIIIDVAFETLEKAKAVLAALQKLWGKVGVVTSVPKTRFIMMVDSMKV